MDTDRMWSGLFALGDYAGGATVGAITAAAVRAVISHETDMVLAMIIGMLLGMVVHLAVGFLLSPLLGMFQVMVPGSLIGMYGGMLFAMRDTMVHPGTTPAAIAVGAAFGVIVIGSIRLYDHTLRGHPTAES